MVQIFLIAIGAGASSALLSASPLSGNPLSLALAVFSALPIMLVGLIWGYRLALVALVVAVAAIAIVLSPWNAAKYAFAIGGPAYILSYLAMLGRPVENDTEWYPAGRIVFWASLIGAVLAVGFVLSLGSDLQSYRAAFKTLIESSVRQQPGFLEQQVKTLGLNSIDELIRRVTGAVRGR